VDLTTNQLTIKVKIKIMLTMSLKEKFTNSSNMKVLNKTAKISLSEEVQEEEELRNNALQQPKTSRR